MRNFLWLGLLVLFCLPSMVAAVRAEERPPVLILASHHFPPYSIVTVGQDDSAGRAGIFPDIVREAAAKAGWTLKILYVPFKRTDASVAAGRAHALVSHKLVGWRESQYRYSRPLYAVQPAYFTLRDRDTPALRNFGDAAKTDVVVVLGDALIDELSGRGIPATEVPDLQNAVRMLSRGRMTALLSLRRPVENALEHAGMLEHVNMQVIQERPIHLALDRRLPWGMAFLQAFDNALSEMQENGRIEEISAQYTGTYY